MQFQKGAMVYLSPLAGVSLWLMIAAFVAADVLSESQVHKTLSTQLTFVAGILGWIAAVLLLPRITKTQKILIGILILFGIFLMYLVSSKGGPLTIADALSRNAGLLTMIVSVGFLKLVALPLIDEDQNLPVGKVAFRDTLLGIAIFGSIINISAPILIADRLSQRRPLDLFTSASITRIFSGCSAWSPFFGGMAVVLIYVQGVSIVDVMLAGLPFSLTGLLLVYLVGISWHKKSVSEFRGYPMQLSGLWLPALLAFFVVTLSWLAPNLSILTVIALSALIITAVVLVIRKGAMGAVSSLSGFVINELPRTANELTLFLAAGVLAAGLSGIVHIGLIPVPEQTLNGNSACLLLLIMVLVAMAGIHPVIQIAGLTPLLAPAAPDPELLAITFIFAWSLGTCASPLSGTHLVMQGRYGIPSLQGAVNNWLFVFLMYGVAIVILQFTARLNGV